MADPIKAAVPFFCSAEGDIDLQWSASVDMYLKIYTYMHLLEITVTGWSRISPSLQSSVRIYQMLTCSPLLSPPWAFPWKSVYGAVGFARHETESTSCAPYDCSSLEFGLHGVNLSHIAFCVIQSALQKTARHFLLLRAAFCLCLCGDLGWISVLSSLNMMSSCLQQ